MIPAIAISAGWLALSAYNRVALMHEYDPLVWAPRVLSKLRIAPLPKSARDVRVHIHRDFPSAEGFLRFEADPNDIEQFLFDSPGLANITPTPPILWRYRGTTASHSYSAPSWYDQPIPGRARHYRPKVLSNGGEMIVDDERHAVYVDWRK